MAITKILLFTPFPPTQGGGSQNLRSAIPHLNNVEVTWAYLGQKEVEYPHSVHLGKPILDCGFFASWMHFVRFCTNSHAGIKALALQLVELQKKLGASRIWTVAHYEGLAVAEALTQMGVNVHLSIHDDPPFALAGRSRRYFPFAELCEEQFARVLQAVQSVDVTSHPMGERYLLRYGVPSVAYFPYIHHLWGAQPPKDNTVLRAGFLGTLYTPKEAKVFADALKIVQKRTSTPVEWHFWGLGARQQAWVKKLAVPTFQHKFVPEIDLVDALAPMHLLYVNYPFDKNSDVFRQTSHPAKLSTYLKAQRPLFAHTPSPSSLADFVSGCGLGVVSDSHDPNVLAGSLQLMLATPIPAAKYAQARASWYGEENLELLRRTLVQATKTEAPDGSEGNPVEGERK